MDVSIIIVNYKTTRLIIDCVKSITRLTEGIEYEVIIVDNNSEDNFKDVIFDSIPGVHKDRFHFISLPENVGFGRANNEGIRIAKGRNILFLNPDTLLLNNAIKILSDFLDSHPEAGACGGNLYDTDLKAGFSYKRILPGIKWETNEFFNTLPEKLQYGENRYFNHTEQNIEVGYISGADLMVKSEVLKETGDFRKEYFLYYEETDLCYRIKRKGWKIYSVPSAKIQHLESKSFGLTEAYQSEFKTEYLEKSRNIFYRLNKAPFSRQISQLIYQLFLITRIFLIKSDKKKKYYRQRMKYFNCK